MSGQSRRGDPVNAVLVRRFGGPEILQVDDVDRPWLAKVVQEIGR
jgi:hypothetical protein